MSSQIFGRLANTAMIYFLILALWGLWRALRKQDWIAAIEARWLSPRF
jgi:cytochrome oxidase assembly protein ShyY1